jgi:glucokinase
MEQPLVLGVDVGGSSIRAAVFDADLAELGAATVSSPRGPAVLDGITAAARQAIDAAGTGARLAAAGVAMLGLLDLAQGRCLRSVNLDATDLPVTGPLADRLGVPVVLGHDVRSAAEAERRLGAPDLEDPVVVVIGTGVAATSYVRGEPVAGVSGQAGELGHLVVRPGGPACGCGRRGCLEAVASAAAIRRAYAERTGADVPGALDVLERCATDPVAAAVWDDACAALADGLLAACALLAPGAFVLGGGLGEAGAALRDPVARHLAARAGVLPVPPVRSAVLGGRAGLLGAALSALDRLGLPTPPGPAT